MRNVCKIYGMASAILLTSCNADVFIDDFLSEPPEITVTAEKASVNFKAKNWGILGIAKNFLSSIPVYTIVCDPAGNPMKSLPLEEGELAVVAVKDEFVDFRIEKKDDRRLEVIRGENLDDGPARYLIEVGNRYERKMISVVFPPSVKYRIDDVVYEWDALFLSNNSLEPASSVIVDNSESAAPVGIWIRPYRDAFRGVSCSFDTGWKTREFAKIFGSDLPELTIPDIAEGRPVLNDTKIVFGTENQKIDAGLDRNYAVEVSINAGEKRRVEVYIQMEKYSVPFKVYASNPETGRKKIVSGTMYSERPFDYTILKRKAEDERDDH